MAKFDDEEAVFNAALDREDGQARAAFLDEACGGNSEFRRRIDQLLSAFEEGDCLSSPRSVLSKIRLPFVQEKPGTIVGNYQLLEQIGEGGMGDIYLARRVEGSRQNVALKVIKPGMDSRQLMARFELERTSLAKMDHPHIAQFIEAGVSEQGRAYFVMELVRGLPITEYCDRQRLQVTQRLKLVVDLCLAVEHAHSKGLVHRDLKPGNVLVTEVEGEPVVKVIDFGVAKALDPELNERTIFTRPTQFMGTPIYMSPEQVRWCPDVDIRSDVYSIGVLLYELLSGSTPIDKGMLRTVGLEELRRMIQEQEAEPPSTRIASLPPNVQTAVAAARGVSPKQLKAQVRGDLDWITLMALAKDRAARYDTPGELAQDLNRFSTYQVVSARAPSPWTRGRKWARRNSRTTRTIAACVLISTVIASGLWVRRAMRETSINAGWSGFQIQLEWPSLGMVGRALITGDESKGYLRVTDPIRETFNARLDIPPRLDHEPVASETAGFAAIAGHDDQIYLCSLSNWQIQRRFHVPWNPHTMSISRDGRYVAGGCADGRVWIMDLTANRYEVLPHTFGPWHAAVAFSPIDDVLIIAACGKMTLMAFRVPTFEPIQSAETTASIKTLRFHPNGRILAVGQDPGITLWDVRLLRKTRTLPGHPSAVRGLAFAPDGHTLASVALDGVRIWEVRTGREVHMIKGRPPRPDWIHFADSATIMVGSWVDDAVYRYGEPHVLGIAATAAQPPGH